MLDQMSACHSERERLQLMFEQAPGFMALVEGSDHQIAIANRAFVDLVGRRALIGKPLAEALPEFDVQGIDDILNGVARSGQAFVGHAMPLSIERPDGSTEEALVDVVSSRFLPSMASPAAFSSRGTTSPRTREARPCGTRTAECSSWRSATRRWKRR
jgi:PAS domain-containing protein